MLECRQIIQYRKIQEDVRTESSWKNKVKLGISKPSDLKSPLNYYALAESLTSFISNHHAGDIIQGLELDIESLSSLCHERWVFTELTSAFCNILNKQSSSSSISIDLSSIAIENLNVILKQPIDVFDTINMILLVGIYDNHITFTSKTGIGANHYAVAVYIVHRNMVMYCDPKGWPTPATFKSELIDALSAIIGKEKASACSFYECHRGLSADGLSHKCTQFCCQMYPLQTCGTVCGISSLITISIAALDMELFYTLTHQAVIASPLAYLKDVSRYSDLLRLTVFSWMQNKHVNLDNIVTSSIISPKDTSIDFSLQLDQEKAENKFSEGFFVEGEEEEKCCCDVDDENISDDKVDNDVNQKQNDGTTATVDNKFEDNCANNKVYDNGDNHIEGINEHHFNRNEEEGESYEAFFTNDLASVKADSDVNQEQNNVTTATATVDNTFEDNCANNEVYNNGDNHIEGMNEKHVDRNDKENRSSEPFFTNDIASVKADQFIKQIESNGYACKLCTDIIFKYKSKAKRHVTCAHLNITHTASLKYFGSDWTLFPCKNVHEVELSTRNRSHYHCFICDFKHEKKPVCIKHIKRHETEAEDMPVVGGAGDDVLEDALEDEQEDTNEETQRQPDNSVKCDTCGQNFHPRSIVRHMQTKHTIITQPKMSVCVDKNKGLFMVKKYKKGVGFPCHVKKLLHDIDTDNNEVGCEMKTCQILMNTMIASNMLNAECHHLRETENSLYPASIELDEELLWDLDHDHQKIISTETIQICIQLHSAAALNRSDVVVEFDDGNYLHFSVFNETINYYSQFARVIVTLNKVDKSLKCPCNKNPNFCRHKASIF